MKKVELKKLSIGLAVILFAAMSLDLHASAGELNVTSVDGKQMVRVSIDNPGSMNIKLSVQSLEGNSNVYAEELAGSDFYSKVFDLSNLEDVSTKLYPIPVQ